MQMASFVSILSDVAQAFFSILELLLTRLIPVFATLIVSCLLRFFHWLVCLATESSKRRCCTSLEDRTGEGFFDTPFEDDDGGVESSSKNDGHSYVEGQVSLQSNNPCCSTVSEGEKESSVSGFRNETISRDPSQTDSPDAETTYPSDLPTSLNDFDRNPGADSRSMRNRSLPPSWSMMKRTLKESSRKDSFQEESQETVQNPVKQTNSKASAGAKHEAPKTDSECFTARFRRHFLMDR